MRALAIGLGLVAVSIVSSCLVSTFEKVDALGDAGLGGNAGDSGGSDATGGQAGQLGSCAPGCLAGPNGEEACCFFQPGSPPDECGYELADENDACWAPDQATTAGGGCSDSTHGSGCCLESGLCGYMDTVHGLGCVATEVYGDPPEICGDNPCGEYCKAALALSTPCPIIDPAAKFPVWDCGQRCKERPCLNEIQSVLESCNPNGACMENGDLVYGGPPGCPTSLLPLAKCIETSSGIKPDCILYCSMVTSACTQASALQYASVDDCLDLCGPLFGGAPQLAIGSFNDGSDNQNTLACRLRALGDSTILTAPIEQMCAGAGPAGDFTNSGFRCGSGMCESYCAAFALGCAAAFAVDYPNGPGDCVTVCSTQFPNPTAFVWETSPINDDLGCRIRESLQGALEPQNTAHCDSAHISSPCPP